MLIATKILNAQQELVSQRHAHLILTVMAALQDVVKSPVLV